MLTYFHSLLDNFLITKSGWAGNGDTAHIHNSKKLKLLTWTFACQLLCSFPAWGGASTACPPEEPAGVKCVGPVVSTWRYGADYADVKITYPRLSTLNAALVRECEYVEQRYPNCSCEYGEPTPFIDVNNAGTGYYGEYGFHYNWKLGEEELQKNLHFGNPGVIFKLTCGDQTNFVPGSIDRIRDVECPPRYRINGMPYDPDYTGATLSYCVGKVIRDDTCQDGNPIVIGNGNKHQVGYDYRSETIGFYRTYNSRSYDVEPNDEPMGKQWRHNYERYLIIPTTSEIEGVIRSFYALRPDGRVNHFRLAGGEIKSDIGIKDHIERAYDINQKPIGWNYIAGNGEVELYDDSGMLVSIASPQGRVVSLTYDGKLRLIGVHDDVGRSLTFTYDSSGRIATLTDPDEEVYIYEYGSTGNLASVTYPDETPSDTTDNPQRIYHYEDSRFPYALTGITDENGNRFATWTYDYVGRAISSEHANGVEKTAFDYTYLEDNSDPRVTVTNPLGKQTTYHFVVIDDMRKVTQVEGHPTTSCEGANKSYQYDANGNVISKTDWNGVITTYTYDMARNLELSRTEAVGTPQERTITTEWHADYRLPAKITEPDRITEYTYDVQGRQLSSKTSGTQ